MQDSGVPDFETDDFMGVPLAPPSPWPLPEGIQVNVPDQLKKVGFLFAEDRLVAVLKKVARSFVPFVKRDRISGKETPHKRGYRNRTGTDEQMDVI
jgi:hypothetical protein